MLVISPVTSFGWVVAASGAGALPDAIADCVTMGAPMTAMIPAMANALSFVVKVMPCSFACGVDVPY